MKFSLNCWEIFINLAYNIFDTFLIAINIYTVNLVSLFLIFLELLSQFY